jgi:hypothetical protein
MAATNLIPNKFLFYKTEAAFLEDLNKNFISDLSLALVLDKRFIYSHGDYFYCNFSQDDCKILAQSLSSIDNKITEIETVTSNALHKLEQDKVGKDEIDVEAIKNEIYNECNEIASKSKEEINKIADEISNKLDDVGIDEMSRIISTALSRLQTILEENETSTSRAVNDLIYKMQNMEVENTTAHNRIIEMQQNVTLDVDLSIDENGNLIITY